jgi:putative toxin-antitoxin system antitoxin component (TIGR02293 family)
MILMLDPRRISEVLGVERGRSITSLMALSGAVEHGLPKSALRRVVQRVYTEPSQQRALMNRIVPAATYKRRRDRLSAAESARTERLARVVAMAEDVWQDSEDARRFLKTPNPELGGMTPLEAAMTELGARQAEEVLIRLEYGLPA